MLGMINMLVGPLYLIAIALLVLFTCYVWIPKASNILMERCSFKNCIKVVAVSLIIVGILMTLSVATWIVGQSILNPVARIDNVDEHPSMQEVVKQPPLTENKADENKDKFKDKTKQTHEKALSDFEKKMQEEADKIKNRNE